MLKWITDFIKVVENRPQDKEERKSAKSQG